MIPAKNADAKANKIHIKASFNAHLYNKISDNIIIHGMSIKKFKNPFYWTHKFDIIIPEVVYRAEIIKPEAKNPLFNEDSARPHR